MVKVNIKFSNSFLYTFITIVGIILISVIVFAYSGTIGHTSDQIDEVDPSVPTSCTVDQVLEWNSTDWDCADASSGSSLPTTCSTNQVLKWDTSAWVCADDVSETTSTYTTTRSCGSGDELIASRYDARTCCGSGSGCSDLCCTTTPEAWQAGTATPSTCTYNDKVKILGVCITTSSPTCTENTLTSVCRTSL